jgi:hypothetical protein
MKYGILVGVTPPAVEWYLLCRREVLRVIVDVKSTNSCRNLFISLEILPLPCEYIFTLMNFVVNNQEHFRHNVNTRNKDHVHGRTANLSCLKKIAYYADIKITCLPSNLRSLTNIKAQFKVASKRYLYSLFLPCWEIPNV